MMIPSKLAHAKLRISLLLCFSAVQSVLELQRPLATFGNGKTDPLGHDFIRVLVVDHDESLGVTVRPPTPKMSGLPARRQQTMQGRARSKSSQAKVCHLCQQPHPFQTRLGMHHSCCWCRN